ncbi:MAG: secretin N-terminal domain-containing protein, partial [Thermodesulfobacteriota bacterium]
MKNLKDIIVGIFQRGLPRRAVLMVALSFMLALPFHSGAAATKPAGAADKVGKADKADKAGSEKLTVNFVDVDITTLVRFISDSTGKNFVYDDRLKGKVTIIAPTPLDRDEAFNLFTSILALKGFATVFTGKVYKIVPGNLVRQSSVEVLGADTPLVETNEGYIARLIPLKHTTAHEFMPVLKPLISTDGYISAFAQSNALLIQDTALNLKKILKIIEMVDVEQKSSMPEIVLLKHADVEEIKSILTASAAGGARGGKAPQRQGGAGSVKFVADKRLNAVIIFGERKDIERYKKLIAKLDVPSEGSSSRINVYYLENAEAKEIAEVLKGLVGDNKSRGGQSANQIQRAGRPMPVPPPGIQGVISQTELSGKIAITPHEATNSIIIMAAPESYATLKRVIEMLDRRPKQVFVEAMIMEVSISDALELGSKWRTSATDDGKVLAVGGLGNVDTGTVANLLTGIAGFTLG